MTSRLAAWIVLVTVLASGCLPPTDVPSHPLRTVFAIQVDALRDSATAPAKKSYALFPGLEGVADADLQYREVARYARKALAARGFTEAADPAKAEIAIFLNYGIGEPRTTYFTYSYPVLGIVGPETYTFHSTTVGEAGRTTTTGTLEPFPRVGVVGTETRIGSATVYFRFLVFEAIDVVRSREAKKPIPTWKTIVTSTGSSGDLRRILPALVVAGQPHLGEHTDHQVDVLLEETDPAILDLRKTE